MALPTKGELKAVLRIQSTAEDAVLDLMMTQAKALVEAMLDKPIASVPRTFLDKADTNVAYGRVSRLIVPVTPVDWSTMAIEDVDGTALVEDEDYRVGTPWSGEILALPGVSFSNGPYTIDIEVGLENDPEYATRIEPVISAAILDVAQDLWHRRNPAATNESTGGGVSTTYQPGAPERARQMLRPFCRIGVA